VRTKLLIVVFGAVSLMFLEAGYSIALQRYDAKPSPFYFRGPVTATMNTVAGFASDDAPVQARIKINATEAIEPRSTLRAAK
jgi:hypothetical protein